MPKPPDMNAETTRASIEPPRGIYRGWHVWLSSTDDEYHPAVVQSPKDARDLAKWLLMAADWMEDE